MIEEIATFFLTILLGFLTIIGFFATIGLSLDFIENIINRIKRMKNKQ